MASLRSSRRFWDEKARENPYWYVSSYVEYANPDLDEFWASGQQIWDEIKAGTGYVPDPSDTVVEIGCGIGRLTRAIARDAGCVHAFDLSREMLSRAQVEAPSNVHFHCSGGDGLEPVAAGAAQYVLAYLVFQHLPNEQVLGRYLNEMVRVVGVGGTIAFTTSPRNWRTLLLPLMRARAYVADALTAGGPKGLHRREWTGIRPSAATTKRLCPISLQMRRMPGERWLFWGRRPAGYSAGS